MKENCSNTLPLGGGMSTSFTSAGVSWSQNGGFAASTGGISYSQYGGFSFEPSMSYSYSFKYRPKIEPKYLTATDPDPILMGRIFGEVKINAEAGWKSGASKFNILCRVWIMQVPEPTQVKKD